MVLNPYILTPYKYQAWGEGFWAAYFSNVTPEPRSTISVEDYDAFNEGVVAGAEASANGISFADPCMPLIESEPGALTVVGAGAGALFNIAKWSVQGFSMLAVTLLRASISLQTFYVDPQEFLRDYAPDLLNFLTGDYDVHNVAVYMGGGVDRSMRNCELMVTPIFSTQRQARDAVIQMTRPSWFIYEWRSDQSGGLTIVDWKE